MKRGKKTKIKKRKLDRTLYLLSKLSHEISSNKSQKDIIIRRYLSKYKSLRDIQELIKNLEATKAYIYHFFYKKFGYDLFNVDVFYILLKSIKDNQAAELEYVKLDRLLFILSLVSLEVSKKDDSYDFIISTYIKRYPHLLYVNDALVRLHDSKFDIHGYFTRKFIGKSYYSEIFYRVLVKIMYFEKVSKDDLENLIESIRRREVGSI